MRISKAMVILESSVLISGRFTKASMCPSVPCRRVLRGNRGTPTTRSRRSTKSVTRLFSTEASSGQELSLLSSRLDGLDSPTVWHEFSPLAVKHGAINLGQGFPDWDPPSFAVEAMEKSVDPKNGRNANQYARSYAHMPLARVLAEDYTMRWKNTNLPEIDPATMIGTAVGCTNALYCTLQGLLNPGEEVVLLEPAFDIYTAQVRMAGGVPVYVPLRPNGVGGASDVFQLDFDELDAAITSNTKVLLLNSPHNPTGKMFNREELEHIAKVLDRHPQVVVISDEVYEHITFDPENEPHISIASISAEMFDRTLTLSSSGKTFSCTGWKVGWCVGPPHLVKAMTAAQQWVNFSAPTPNQDAIAQCLQQARQPYEGFDSFYSWLAAEYKRKRGLLADALRGAGMTPVIPPGGFFIMADTADIDFPYDPTEVTEAMPVTPMPRDWSLSRWLTKNVGVTAIPPSAFYSTPNVPLANNLLRFAFCKGDDTILQADQRLQDFFSGWLS